MDMIVRLLLVTCGHLIHILTFVQEKNYRTYCAQNDIPLDDGPCDPNDAEEEMDLDAADEWEGIMDIDEDEDELPQFFKEERDRKRDEKMANPTKRKKKG